MIASSPAAAATFSVDNTRDDSDQAPGDGVCATMQGVCTLRAALQETNALSGADTVVLPAGWYTLTQGALVITDQLSLLGADSQQVLIDAAQRSRVLEVSPAGIATGDEDFRAYVRGVTLMNGVSLGPFGAGGGVFSTYQHANLTLEQCWVKQNSAQYFGGGIYNRGYLRLVSSRVSQNRVLDDYGPYAIGGGAYNAGVLDIRESLIEGNHALRGGGIGSQSGSVYLSNSTVSNNAAQDSGGAVFSAWQQDSTRVPVISLSFTTIVDNVANGADSGGLAGGIFNDGLMRMSNSIVARNYDGRDGSQANYTPDCFSGVWSVYTSPNYAPQILSQGGNLIGVYTSQCSYRAQTGDQRGTPQEPLDPMVDALTGDGSTPLLVHPLQPRSPAINAAVDLSSTTSYGCPAVDMRGFERPLAGRCDVGAYEAYPFIGTAALVLVGDTLLSASDLALTSELRALGLSVEVRDDSASTGDVEQFDLLVISESVDSSLLSPSLSGVRTRILCMEPAFFDELGMTGDVWGVDQGVTLGQTEVYIANSDELSAGRSGHVATTVAGAKYAWGVPATADAVRIAEVGQGTGHWAIFRYPGGSHARNGAYVPATRMAFFAADGALELLTRDGRALLRATLLNVPE